MTRNFMIMCVIVLASCSNDGTKTQNGDTTDQVNKNNAAEENYIMENNVENTKKKEISGPGNRSPDSIKMVPATDTTSSMVDTIK